MIEIIQKGGPLIWLLLGCSVLAGAVAIDRFFYFQRCTVNVGELMQGIGNYIREGRFDQAAQAALNVPGPIGRVLHCALIRHQRRREELRDILQESAQLEVHRTERYMPVLSTIAIAAPLIGLLGTVLGLINTFIDVSEVRGYVTPVQLADGVYQSLYTSAAGLAVGVPVYIVYNYLVSRATALRRDMERAGIELLNLIGDYQHDSGVVSGVSVAQGEADKEAAGKALSTGGARSQKVRQEN